MALRPKSISKNLSLSGSQWERQKVQRWLVIHSQKAPKVNCFLTEEFPCGYFQDYINDLNGRPDRNTLCHWVKHASRLNSSWLWPIRMEVQWLWQLQMQVATLPVQIQSMTIYLPSLLFHNKLVWFQTQSTSPCLVWVPGWFKLCQIISTLSKAF